MMLSRPHGPSAASLLLNGYALVVNAGLTALLGIVFWIVATRLYTPDQVGLAAALISAMTTISYFSQMNLGSVLTRFLPTSEAGAGLLIARTYALTGLVAAAAAALFATGIGLFAPALDVLGRTAGFTSLFVAATVIWTIFALQDAALSGLRQSAWVPVENALYALVKIALLLLFGLAAQSPPLGIFYAWTIPLVPLTILVNLLIHRHLRANRPDIGHKGPDLRTARQFWGWDFLGSLALGAAFGLAPLLVTATAGLEATASYHLAWSITYSIYLVGRAMSVSLVAEGAAHPIRLNRLIADSLTHTLLLVCGAVCVILIFAPRIMGLFGAAYVDDGALILRLLALSCVPWSVTTIYCAAARVRRRTRAVAIVQIGTLVVMVSASAPLLVRYGAAGVALGWLVAHTTVCAALFARLLLKEGRVSLADWSLSILGSAMRMIVSLPGRSILMKSRDRPVPPEILQAIDHAGLGHLARTQLTGSTTDVGVILLHPVDPSDSAAKVVLKFSSTESGIASIRSNARVLRALAADPRLDSHAHLLPGILVEAEAGRYVFTAETGVDGIEGRQLLRNGRNATPALAAALSALSDMHRATSVACIIDDDWARHWIDGPIETVSHGNPRQSEAKAAALIALRAELRSIFVGRRALLGLGHGDIWPGNLFFTPDRPGGDRRRLSGLVDWGTFRPDALAGIDACQLGLTFRMASSGEEFGPIVRRLLAAGHWTRDERALFTAVGLEAEFAMEGDPVLRRGILLLTWLCHVAMVIGQSDTGTSRHFWTRVNIDNVLTTIARTTPRIGP